MCSLATKDEYVGNNFPGYSAEMPKRGANWIDMKKKERGQTPMIDIGYIPTMCQHCDDAPCLKASKNNAVVKRDDGIIIIDPDKSKGQKQIVDSCPHGSISWNEELEIPQIWFFDAHLLDNGWKAPRGVSVCATNAMRAVKVEDDKMKDMVKEENLETLNPEFNTKPRVYYKNLYRFNKNLENRMMFMAHWDTREIADKDPIKENRNLPILGANDGASGIAILMVLADMRTKNSLYNIGVDLLFLDGEDMGQSGDINGFGLGTLEFTKNMPLPLPRYAICLDMVADKEPSFPMEIFSLKQAPELVYKVWDIANDLGYHQFKREIGQAVYDDHRVLYLNSGIPSIDIIDLFEGKDML